MHLVNPQNDSKRSLSQKSTLVIPLVKSSREETWLWLLSQKGYRAGQRKHSFPEEERGHPKVKVFVLTWVLHVVFM